MNFIKNATKRYSVRKYTDQKVEPEKLEQILEAARVAPTAANRQPVRLEPINILAIGYADGEAADLNRHAQARIPLEELVSYEEL